MTSGPQLQNTMKYIQDAHVKLTDNNELSVNLESWPCHMAQLCWLTADIYER